jgi:PEGA domain
MSLENSASDSVAPPAPPEVRSLSQTLRGHVSLTRLQGVCGMAAALLSIGGAFGYFVPPKSDRGEVLAIVQEARSGKPVADATVEVLTLHDALVTTLPPAAGVGSARAAPMKEGTYRLRVQHPRYVTESRQIYVLAGQTAEIRLRLAPRPAPPPPPPAVAAEKPSGPFEGLKKLFR